MKKSNVLFITHNETQCGVYDFGERVLNAINTSNEYNFIKVICLNLNDLKSAISKNRPVAIIYNYTVSTLPWITKKIFRGVYYNNISKINIPQIGIIHEITQNIADTAVPKKTFCITKLNKLDNSLFDFYIAADPTLLLKNPLVFKTGRVIANYYNNFQSPSSVIVSSFGFGTEKKGFENIINQVQLEFDKAEIRINIPFSEFCDKGGQKAKHYEEKCKKLIYKPDIKLIFTNKYYNAQELLDFLAQSTINVFLYEDKVGRGVSSVLDYALAVSRPIAVSSSIMFRHIFDANPSMCIQENSLKQIIENGTKTQEIFKTDWSPENQRWEYERIINSTISHKNKLVNRSLLKNLFTPIKDYINRHTRYKKENNWLRTTEALYEDNYKKTVNNFEYIEVPLSPYTFFNRILDDEARNQYKNTVDKLFELVPKTMAKKIPRANVNQAFVFDAVWRLKKNYADPKILCVGSYEDTACMGLIKIGYKIEEIDPMTNYFIQDFVSKPSIKNKKYDIIFSTSVIEHDEDDESFIKSVDRLLAPGGVFIMSCDFKNGWKQGDRKPFVCARFYTEKDLTTRLLSYMNNCRLIDTPNWSSNNSDFIFGPYQYTFSGFVVKKSISSI